MGGLRVGSLQREGRGRVPAQDSRHVVTRLRWPVGAWVRDQTGSGVFLFFGGGLGL